MDAISLEGLAFAPWKWQYWGALCFDQTQFTQPLCFPHAAQQSAHVAASLLPTSLSWYAQPALVTGQVLVGLTGGAGGAGGDGVGCGGCGDGGKLPQPTILPLLVFVSNKNLVD